MISPRLDRPAIGQADREARPRVGRQDRPLAGSSGSRSRRPGNRAACWAASRDGSVRKKPPAWFIDSDSGPAARQDIAHADQQLAPPWPQHLVERRHLGLEGVVDADDGPADWRRHWRCRGRPECRARRAARPGPMPESCSSCGELIEPPRQDHFAAGARDDRLAVLHDIRRRRRGCPRTGFWSPARSSRRGRLLRFIAGRRKARAADMRRPFLVVIW